MARMGFGVRLAVAGLITLAVILFVSQRVVTASVHDNLIAENAAIYRADADGIAASLSAADRGGMAPNVSQQLLDSINARPAVVHVELVDVDGRVVTVSPAGDAGSVEADASLQVARSGKSYSGPETEMRDVRNEFTFITPLVTASGERFALEVDEDASLLNTRVADLNQRLLWLSLLALPGGAALFFVLGGRRLVQRHNTALAGAQHDGLTGLGNRRQFEARLAEETRQARRRREPLVLAIADVDDFKLVNDRYGHLRGDEILQLVAHALGDGRQADEAFRFGGDEFAVLMPNITLDGAREAMERRGQAAAAASHGVSLSIGLAALGADGQEAMFEQADAAAYAAKQMTGTAIVASADEPVNPSASLPDRLRLVAEALDAGNITADLRGLDDLTSGRRVGAVARPAVPTPSGTMCPAEAVALAQDLGRTGELLAQSVDWTLAHAEELDPRELLVISIAAETLDHALLSRGLAERMRAVGLTPDRVAVELTGIDPGQTDALEPHVRELRRQGFKLATTVVAPDGTGERLSGLSIELDCFALHAELVDRAGTDKAARALVAAVRAYAEAAGATVVVEQRPAAVAGPLVGAAGRPGHPLPLSLLELSQRRRPSRGASERSIRARS